MLSRFLLITNGTQARRGCGGLLATLERALEGGADFIQVREKGLEGAELRELSGRVVERAAEYGARVVVNTHADIAREVGAAGVHLPADGLDVDEARKILGSCGLVGVSTHSLDEAETADRSGADYATLSPIFETPSKPGYGPALGLNELARVVEAVEIPIFALAGITPERVEPSLQAGAYGVAVMGGVMRVEKPGEVVGAYRERLVS